MPELFRFYHEQIGIGIEDCLKTFNWGVGYYIFLPQQDAERVVALGESVGYELTVLGVVEEGERQVIFGPANIILNPPGE